MILKAYNTVYDQKGMPSIWNVSASQPFALEAYEWHFPILGTVPYKGYFNSKYADEEIEKLNTLGLDTRVREAAAWSTLGIMNDPILTNFLANDIGEIAELIIHEMTHGTIWVKGGVELNENLATFIGEKGAEDFLEYYYGVGSAPYVQYINSNKDYVLFADHVLRGASYLEKMYQKMDDITYKTKVERKNEVINEIISSLDTLSFRNPNWKTIKMRLLLEKPNNAYFMSFLRYRAKQSDFEEEFNSRFRGKISLYIAYLKDLHG